MFVTEYLVQCINMIILNQNQQHFFQIAGTLVIFDKYMQRYTLAGPTIASKLQVIET